MSNDHEHLKLLSVFHYVIGGLTALLACLPLIHLILGITMLTSPTTFANRPGETPPPAFIGWLFTAMGAAAFLGGQAMAVCMLLAGRYIGRCQAYMFVFVTACIECIFMPFGTVLGVFSIVVLMRDSVKVLFGRLPAAPPPLV
jgi:hypothetical protein